MEYKFKVGDHVTKSSKLPPFLNGDLVALKGEKDPVGYVYMTGIKNGYVTVSKIVTMYGESKFGDYAIEDLVLVPEVTQKQEVKSEGRKYDSGKPRYSLLPPLALEEVVHVLTFGSQKYEDFNWMKVQNANDRYFSAANRHLWQWKRGEIMDEETKRHHLASAITNLMFILEMELMSEEVA